MNYGIRVSDEAFAYLRIQKGSLEPFAGDRAEWHRRYEADLRATFEHIERHLPMRPDSLRLLDVGSGVGGIDVLIRRNYEDDCLKTHLHLLDGIADPPVMNLHRETFNNMNVARAFQEENGLELDAFRAWSPETKTFGDQQFDLVVSFGSWCFHYPPAVYLRQVHRSIASGAVLILDVRRNRPEWMRVLEQVFELVTMVELKPKYSRCVFKVRAE